MKSYEGQRAEETKKNQEALADQLERRILVFGSLGLSVLGVFAFLITRQVFVVAAMNAPLLAVIGAQHNSDAIPKVV